MCRPASALNREEYTHRYTQRSHDQFSSMCVCISVVPADVQQLLVKKEEVPSEQQEDKPEPPHIEEKEEREQLQWLKEAEFIFTAVPVKSDEDDVEKPQSSQLHQRQTEQKKTEADGDNCGGAEPTRNSDPERYLHPDTESGDSDNDWTESRKTRRGLNSVKNKKVPVRDGGCKLENNHFQCSECGKCFDSKGKLKLHTRVHTGEKPFSCLFCGKRFSQKGNSIGHMRIHTGEKPFSCLICKRSFRYSGDVSRHMRIHTQRKTFTADSNIHTAPGLARGFNPHRPSQQGT